MIITKAEVTTFSTYLAGVLVPLILKYFNLNMDVTMLSSIIMFIIIFISEKNPRLKYVDDELLKEPEEEPELEESGGA